MFGGIPHKFIEYCMKVKEGQDNLSGQGADELLEARADDLTRCLRNAFKTLRDEEDAKFDRAHPRP